VVDRYRAGLTGQLGTIWIAGCSSDGYGAAQVVAAASGRRRSEARRRTAASGGATRKQRWGAPFAAGSSPKRRARARELSRGPPRRRRRRAAAHGKQRRRRGSGEAEPATRCTSVQTISTSVLLTSTRGSRSASWRRKNDGGEKSSGGRLGFCATAAEGGAARVAARRACAIGRRGGL
jgi:hypothetical protein